MRMVRRRKDSMKMCTLEIQTTIALMVATTVIGNWFQTVFKMGTFIFLN